MKFTVENVKSAYTEHSNSVPYFKIFPLKFYIEQAVLEKETVSTDGWIIFFTIFSFWIFWFVFQNKMHLRSTDPPPPFFFFVPTSQILKENWKHFNKTNRTEVRYLTWETWDFQLILLIEMSFLSLLLTTQTRSASQAFLYVVAIPWPAVGQDPSVQRQPSSSSPGILFVFWQKMCQIFSSISKRVNVKFPTGFFFRRTAGLTSRQAGCQQGKGGTEKHWSQIIALVLCYNCKHCSAEQKSSKWKKQAAKS